MIIMLSSGEYSDYTVDALYQGDRDRLQAGFKAYCEKVGNGDIDPMSERAAGIRGGTTLEMILGKFGCKKLEYEEVNWNSDDGVRELHKFIGLEKQDFLVKVSFQRDLNITAYSSAEAEQLAEQHQAQLQNTHGTAQAGLTSSPAMKPRVVSVQKLGLNGR